MQSSSAPCGAARARRRSHAGRARTAARVQAHIATITTNATRQERSGRRAGCPRTGSRRFAHGPGEPAAAAAGSSSEAARRRRHSTAPSGGEHRAPVEARAERRGRGAAGVQVLERGDDPLGGLAVAVGVRGLAPSSRRRTGRSAGGRPSATIRSGSVPTSASVPASTPSLRSVVSRVTSTGLPSAGASSWMPPESVITRWQRASRRANSRSRAARRAGRCRATRAAAAGSSARAGSGGAAARTRRPGGRRRAARSPRRCPRRPSPQFSRRCAVTSTMRRSLSNSSCTLGIRRTARRALEAQCSASIARVAGDEDLLDRDVLADQVLLVRRRRRQVQAGDARDQLAVELLGERRHVAGAGAQPGLDVHHGNAEVEGRERRADRRAGVAVDEHGGREAPRAHVLGGRRRRRDLVEPLVAEVLEAQHHRRDALVEARRACRRSTASRPPRCRRARRSRGPSGRAGRS